MTRYIPVFLLLILGSCRSEAPHRPLLSDAERLFDTGRMAEALTVLDALDLSVPVALLRAHTLFFTAPADSAYRAADRIAARLERAISDGDSTSLTLVHLGRALHIKGLARFNTGNLRLADQLQQQSLGLARKAGDERLQADALRQLGVLEWYRGRVDSAEKNFYNPALELYRRLGDRAGEATTLSDIGLLAWQKKDWTTHTDYQMRALAIRKEIDDWVGLADSYNFLSSIPRTLGAANLPFELEYLKRSLDLSARAGYAWGENLARQALRTLLTRHFTNWGVSDDTTLTIVRDGNKEFEIINLMIRASADLAAKNWTGARKVLDRVIRMADEGDFLNFRVHSRLLLSEYYARSGRVTDAELVLDQMSGLLSAYAVPNVSVAVRARIAELRFRRTGDRTSRRLLDSLTIASDRIYLSFMNGSSGGIALADEMVEAYRLRRMIYGSTISAVESDEAINPSDRDREILLLMDRERLLPLWATSAGWDDDNPLAIRIRKLVETADYSNRRMDRLLVTIGEMQQTLSEREHSITSAMQRLGYPRALPTDSLARLLEPAEAYVSYRLVRNRLYIGVIRRDTTVVLSKSVSRSKLIWLTGLLHAAFLRAKKKPFDPSWRTPANTLFQELWEPLREANLIHTGDHVIVAPDYQLYGIPIHALSSGTATGSALVIDSVDVSYATSLTRLMAVRSDHRNGSDRIEVFAPQSKQLPFTAKETASIAALGGDRVRAYVDGEATGHRVMDGFRNASIVHLAAHGHINTSFPLFSRFELADGSVYLRDLVGASVDANLIVLSACESGVGLNWSGDESTSEGLISFPRVFLEAGAEGVISSLWPVEDAATARLMEAFYETGSLSRAMRRYRDRALERGESIHPLFWAGFKLTGVLRPSVVTE